MARPKMNGTVTQVQQTTAEQLYPVKLLKNYRPKTENFEVLDFTDEDLALKVQLKEIPREKAERDGHSMAYRKPNGMSEIREEEDETRIKRLASGDLAKVWKGTTIKLPKAEAIDVVRKRVGERADEFAGD